MLSCTSSSSESDEPDNDLPTSSKRLHRGSGSDENGKRQRKNSFSNEDLPNNDNPVQN
jgi:hypothetical protein